MKNKMQRTGIQTTIPFEFETYLQNKTLENSHTDLNEIIFAKLDLIDLSKPIDRNQGLPPQDKWVHVSPLASVGKSGENAVVYSAIVGGDIPEFEFNAIYLHDKNTPNSCGMIIFQRDEIKQSGMTITKSCIMQFSGAAESANIFVDAETWQVDISDLFAACSKIGHTHTLAEVCGSNPNLFINGCFRVNQRYPQNGASTSWDRGGEYYADRWKINGSKVIAGTVSLEWHSNAISSYIRMATSECKSAGSIYQRIEMGGFLQKDFSDRDITVQTDYISKYSGVMQVTALFFSIQTGAVLSGTSLTKSEFKKITNESGIKNISFTLKTPKISNLPVPVSDVGLQISFNFSKSETDLACPDGNFVMLQAKAEWGTIATAIVPDLHSVNFENCQCYFQQGFFSYTGYISGFRTTNIFNTVIFKTVMRSVPSVVLSGGSSFIGDAANVTAGLVTNEKFDMTFTSSVDGVTRFTNKKYVADAEI